MLGFELSEQLKYSIGSGHLVCVVWGFTQKANQINLTEAESKLALPAEYL